MKAKVSGVYAFVLEGSIVYVGSSVRIFERKSEHVYLLRRNKHHSPYFQNSWNLHGEEAFTWVVLAECPKEELLTQEQHFIDLHKPKFNVCTVAGSRLGVPQSAETIEKVRQVHLGRKLSDETKQKIAAALKGNTNGAGQVISEAQKDAIRAALKGKPSPLRGVPRPQEVRDKCSAAQKGKPRPWQEGKKHSAETIEKMRAAALRRIKN